MSQSNLFETLDCNRNQLRYGPLSYIPRFPRNSANRFSAQKCRPFAENLISPTKSIAIRLLEIRLVPIEKLSPSPVKDEIRIIRLSNRTLSPAKGGGRLAVTNYKPQ